MIRGTARHRAALVVVFAVSSWSCDEEAGQTSTIPVVSSASTNTLEGMDVSALPGLIDEATDLYYSGDYDAARALLAFVAERGARAGDPAVEARAETWLGLAAWRQGNLGDARRHGEAALALKIGAGLEDQLSRSYNALGLVAWYETRLAEAEAHFEHAVEWGRKTGDAGRVAAAAGNLGLVQSDLGEFDAARRAFEALRDAGRAREDRGQEANGLTNLGMLSTLIGDPASAIPHLQAAREIYRELDSATEEAAIRQLADAYLELGDLGRARAHYDTALSLANAFDQKGAAAASREMLADVYLHTGNPQAALQRFGDARRDYEAMGMRTEVGRTARGEGLAYLELGDLQRASVRFREALQIHRDTNVPFEELSDQLLLAEVAEQTNVHADADSWLAEASSLAERLDARSARLQAGIAAAQMAERRGDPSRALEILADLDPWLDAGDYSLEWQAEALAARAHAALGHADASLTAGRRAVESVERVRGGIGSAALRTSFVAARRETYGALVVALLAAGRPDEAFHVSDAARGRALMEHLASTSRESGLDATAEWLATADQVLRRVDQLSTSLNDLRRETRDDDDRFEAELAERGRRLVAARAEYETLLETSPAGSPGALILGLGSPTVAEIGAVLRPDEAIVQYLVTEDRLLALVLSQAGVVAFEQASGIEDVATSVSFARRLIQDPTSDESTRRSVLEGLHELLMEPLAAAGVLAGRSRLLIVPHGALTYLPFAALIDPATGRYLVEDYTVTQLPSAAVLPALRGRAGRPAVHGASDFQAFAPFHRDLPGSLEEVETLGATSGAETRIGDRATESEIRGALANARIVHIATHGVLNGRNPMFSHLEVHPDRDAVVESDGRLEVHEILGLEVRSDLVFLSGCDTGLGRSGSGAVEPGEDYATLARALLYAGARDVVATLWPLEDRAAARFAVGFYGAFESQGAAVALAAAQRRMIESAEFASPAYWASYVLSGSG